MSLMRFARSLSGGCLFVWLLASMTAFALAAETKGDMKFHVSLIWGTDQEKPNDAKLRPVEPALIERFKDVFKWKNYFEVNRQDVSIATQSTKKLKLSDKCEVEVHRLMNNIAEISLWGEGVKVRTVKRAVVPGNLIVLAGDDKDKSAWFVVLNPE